MDPYTVQDVAEFTARHGGGTFDAETLEPVRGDGYAVAVVFGTFYRVLADEIVLHGLATVLETAIDEVRRYTDDPYIGTWIDDNGMLHVDPVVILPTLEVAEIVARHFGQLAIYDFAAGESIDVASL